MNKTDLIEAVHEATGLNKTQSGAAVDGVINAISDALSRGDEVILMGFGSFGVRNKPQRQGRNPQTGEIIILPAKKVPRFKPGRTLRQAVAK